MSSKPNWNNYGDKDELGEDLNYTLKEPKNAGDEGETHKDNAMNDLELSVNNPSRHKLESESAVQKSKKKNNVTKISSLDFERIINEYSIQATKKRMFDDDSNLPLDTSEELDQFKPTTTTVEHSTQTYKQYGATSSSEYSGQTFHYDDIGLSGKNIVNKNNMSKMSNEFKSNLDDSNQQKRRRIFFEDTDSTIPLIPLPSSTWLQHDQTFNDTEQIMQKKRKKKKAYFLGFGYTGKTMTRWILTWIIGFSTGALAILIIVTSEKLVYFRLHRLNRLQIDLNNNLSNDDDHVGYFGDDDNKTESSPILLLSPFLFLSWNYLIIFLEYVIFNLVLAISSSFLCFWAPDAVGSGIPEVKAYLNGVRTKSFSTLKLFTVKIVGTILSVSSGLMVGPEGPLVHLGAIIGASITKTRHLEILMYECRRKFPRMSQLLGCGRITELGKNDDNETDCEPFCSNSIFTSVMNLLSPLRNDFERRDFVSIGAASGFAAAFGAPVGGVLFSLEEASSFFDHSILWKSLTATAIATFCIAVFHDDISQYGVISLGDFTHHGTKHFLLIHFEEVPLYAIFGVVGGLLGALFNKFWKYLTHTRYEIYSYESTVEDQKTRNRRWKLLEVASVSILTSFLTFVVPLSFDFVCTETSDESKNFQFNCKSGEKNQMAAILFGSREDAIKHILSDPSSFDPRTLLLVGLLAFPLMVLTFGVPLPAGIFMPTILIGASLGGSAGILIKEYFIPNASPSTFALIGAAAMLAGIQRSTVSLCVILMEGTGLTRILIPVIITIVFARFIGDLFTDGLYEIGMEVKKYPYLEHHVKTEYDIYTASDIMTSSPITVNPVETAESIENLMRTSSHHGFPVVSADKTNKKFLGFVRRDQLIALLECGYFMETYNTDPSQDDVDLLDISNRTVEGGSLMQEALHISDDRFSTLDLKAFDNEGDDGRDAWIIDNVLQVTKDKLLVDSDDTLPNVIYPKKATSSQTKVSVNRNGDLDVEVAKEDKQKHINIGAVMNRGAKCVIETCPLSTAYLMFTTLGLRHLCVLGGETGGEVVGIITRYNMSEEFIKEKTKLK